MEQVDKLVIRAATAPALRERVEAYARLVERFRDMACGYAYSILGDFHLAEDAAQEAFIIAFGKLGQLQEPGAFPGWFRRIVRSACGRVTRLKTVRTTRLDAAEGVASPTPAPHEAAERKEVRDQVLKAVRELPEPQREATTLFYINGYSQKDVADFLEVPVGTVKNRLSASRSRLRERILNMVADTLHDHAPDERFSENVTSELLSRPRLLEIPDHPVRQVWEAIRRALPEYEVIRGDEIIDRDTQMTVSGGPGFACPQRDKVLRASTTSATYRAMAGRKPPVRLLTAGRVFRGAGRDAVEDQTHLKVFHQADALCVEKGADQEALRATVQRVIEGVFETRAPELRWEDEDYRLFVNGAELYMKFNGQWMSIAGTGMLPPEVLRQEGHDPEEVSCFAFGVGLERLAMLKLGIDDIRKLWQPPYVPG